MSGQCDIEELLFRTGLIPLTQRFVYVSYIFYKLILSTAKYHLVKILCFIHIATGKHVHRQSLLPVHPLYFVNVYACIAFVIIGHQAVSGSILCFCSGRTLSSCFHYKSLGFPYSAFSSTGQPRRIGILKPHKVHLFNKNELLSQLNTNFTYIGTCK